MIETRSSEDQGAADRREWTVEDLRAATERFMRDAPPGATFMDMFVARRAEFEPDVLWVGPP